ncbi:MULTISPECIES: thioredoxin domain-containing protein [Yersinia]|uniref:Methylamine dehydrogenase accessory protein MauD n=1 Tax=Yersinia intermedia TaxID=631 RepID=A0A0H5LZD4_YERIN|nr:MULTISPECIES: redoxin domain-containing protein [Yersinia]MCB5309668.1 redoxin domain-containing protein [Yersinia massiliensis]CRY56549.1 methylamine dehydrogenase accessory protein MauD [Yersinia intermedia]
MNTVILFVLGTLSLLVLLLIVAFIALSRQVGVLFERITPVGAMINNNGPRTGEITSTYQLLSLNSGEVTIGGKKNKHQLVLFIAPTCPICKVLYPVINSIKKSESKWLDIVLASDGDEQEHRAFIEQQQLGDIPYVLSAELGMAWHVAKLPFSVLLDEQGKIISKGLINSREQLESLFNAKETGFASLQDYAQKGAVNINN